MRLLIPALLVFLSGCLFSNESTRRVRILNPNLLIITDLATDNYLPVSGASNDLDTTIPIGGVPVPIVSKFNSGGIMSANDIEIVSATGGTVIIERGVSGNAGVNVDSALERLFRPTFHPFGNITVDQGSALREHVQENQ